MVQRRLGRTTSFDNTHIYLRRLGFTFRTIAWAEVSDARVIQLGKRGRWGHCAELVLVSGDYVRLLFGKSTVKLKDPRFEDRAGVLLDAWGEQLELRRTIRPVLAPHTLATLNLGRQRFGRREQYDRPGRGPIRSISYRDTGPARVWSWTWHGPAQALLAAVCLFGLCESILDLGHDQAAAARFHAAKPCTVQQFATMTEQSPAQPQWCVLTHVDFTESFPWVGATRSDGIIFDAVEDDPAQVDMDINGGISVDNYISADLNASSPLPDELTPGDQVTVVATGQLVDGSSDDIAGAVEYQGVTAQTEFSPAIRQTGGTDSVLTFAALALFLGLWAAMSASRRRHTPLGNGALGAALGLAFGLVMVVSYAQVQLNTTSIMPNLYVGLPAAFACGLGFGAFSLFGRNGSGRWRRSAQRPVRGTTGLWSYLAVGAIAGWRRPNTRWAARNRRGWNRNR